MVTKHGPPYFYVGLAEEEMREEEIARELVPTCEKRSWSKDEIEFQTQLGSLLNLTERRILIQLGKEGLMEFLQYAENK
jgi:hypothetical protein